MQSSLVFRAQVTVGALLNHLGHSGFEDHIRGLQLQYSRRAATIMAAMDKHLTGLADWAPVEAGMFLWVKLRGFEDAAQILGELETAKVIVVPGAPLYTPPPPPTFPTSDAFAHPHF